MIHLLWGIVHIHGVMNILDIIRVSMGIIQISRMLY